MNRSILMKLKPQSNPPSSIFRWSRIHTIFSLAKFRLNSPAYKIGSKCMDRRKSPTTPSEPLSEKPRRSTSYTTMTLPNPPKSTQFSLSLSLSLFHQFALQNMSYFKLCDHFLSGKNNQNQWIYLRSSISSSSQNLTIRTVTFRQEFSLFKAISIFLCSPWKAVPVCLKLFWIVISAFRGD